MDYRYLGEKVLIGISRDELDVIASTLRRAEEYELAADFERIHDWKYDPGVKRKLPERKPV